MLRNCCSVQNELLSTIFRYHNIIEIEDIGKKSPPDDSSWLDELLIVSWIKLLSLDSLTFFQEVILWSIPSNCAYPAPNRCYYILLGV